MSLPIISADERMRERHSAKVALVGFPGVGKTTQLKTLPADSTLFVDLEAGDLAVDVGDLAGDGEHFLVDALRQAGFVGLIPDIVLKTRPEIHGNCTELYFRFHHSFFVMQKDRNFHNQMKAPIPVWFWFFDVILFLNIRYSFVRQELL